LLLPLLHHLTHTLHHRLALAFHLFQLFLLLRRENRFNLGFAFGNQLVDFFLIGLFNGDDFLFLLRGQV